MKINFLASKLLRRYPSVHSAVKQYYTRRLLSMTPGVHPAGFEILGPESMQDGSFEPEETGQIQALLQQTDVFVNVGANIGYYICIARQQGVPVVAVEPLDRNVQLLKKNMDVNGWNDVEVLPVGLGDRHSLERIYGGGTAASLVPGWAGAGTDSYELVPVTTLDSILGDRFSGQRILILVDVEGFELNVLKGAVRQLVRDPAPVWFMEICIDEHQPDGTKINPLLQNTFDIFWDHGYLAEKAGCEQGSVSKDNVMAWARGEDLPGTHNFVFRKTDPGHSSEDSR